MGNDDHATAPFPGRPIGADVNGLTLTIYFAATDEHGRHHEQRIESTTVWTLDAIAAELAEYGLTPRDVTVRTRTLDAFVTSLAGTVAMIDRLAAATQRVARAASNILTAHTAGSHA